MRFFSTVAVGVLVFITLAFSVVASASGGQTKGHGKDEGAGHHFEPTNEIPKLDPAERFSGATAIDLKNGMGFNNGTYGKPNPEVQKFASSPTWAVSLSELGYPFENKDRMVTTLDERLAFFEQALWNWARVSDITKPEVKEYAAKATADLAPRLERARSAWSKAKSAGRADWERASDEAKHAFLDVQSFYYSLHRNVAR